jgi:hypothetical protein
VDGRAVSIESRLRRLEERGRGGICPECKLPPDGPGYIVMKGEGWRGETFSGDPNERCQRCGRLLYFVIEVVYGPHAGDEGEGVSPIGPMRRDKA